LLSSPAATGEGQHDRVHRRVGAQANSGRHDDRDVESLIVEVAQGALADAGVSAAEIDQIYSAR